jgi:hypothetical protein
MFKKKAQLTPTVEHLVAVLAGQGERARHLPKKLHDLRDVVVVLVVFDTRLGVEQVVAR